jgi:O-acetylhomoserine (thiol)-lyase
LASAGDHLVVARSSYGGTLTLLKNLFGRLGIEVDVVDINHPCNVQTAIRPNTRAVICEVVGNPTMNIAPIETIAGVAHRAGVPFVVDNTFSPVVCAPFKCGADIVVYSTTKYIAGLGHVIGGAIVDSGNFDWTGNPKWASFNAPDPAYHGVVFTERFGKNALIAKIRTSMMRDIGACPSAFDCYLLRQSLGTLPLRMTRHSENAMAVAEFLASHPKVESVSYPGLPSHPQHDLAKQYFEGGFSGMLAFDIKGGYDAGVKFLNALTLLANVANVGDARSMAIHSASTTHSQLSPSERAAAGIGEGMIRVSVGLEDAADIIADLDAALKA